MPLKLKKMLRDKGMVHADIIRSISTTPTAFSLLLNEGLVPKRRPILAQEVCGYLSECGFTPDELNQCLQPDKKMPSTKARHLPKTATSAKTEQAIGANMILRKQPLTPAAKKHFGLPRDPFLDDIETRDDVFLSPDIRYVRETMLSTCKHGGLLAVVGESGAGKSTLRRDLLDRIQREQSNTILIEPYVLAMEESDLKGKTLRSMQIAEAIINAIKPNDKPKRSSEARFRQMHDLLKNSSRGGNKHVLVIEEAHCLPTATLKHLKRFYELEDGFKKLLAIILIGQPELKVKLSDTDTEVREVVQRCEVVELYPLDNDLDAYLKFKFERIGVDINKVLDSDALPALRQKLTFEQYGRSGNKGIKRNTVSLLYPLAVSNVLCAAMIMAQSIGTPIINADIIKEV